MRGETRLEARHQPSGLNDRFGGDNLSFADYVERIRGMLHRVHLASGRNDAERIVSGNAPFELRPALPDSAGTSRTYRRGILLTHGLTDSPYFMRYLAEFFRQQGFRVLVILLPGHGTQSGDLLDVRWQEWAAAVAWGVDRLAEEADEIYLGGYSAGATLSINHSLIDARVRGLFLFSPALQISHRAAFAWWHKLYSWLIPSAKWVDIKPDLDLYKYESFPKNAAAQMYMLTKVVGARLRGHRGLDIPVFVAASADDATVEVSATLQFMVHAQNPASRLVLYTSGDAIVPADFPGEKLEQVDCVLPEQGILSSAHTAIVIPPEDAHYGSQGDYSNCIHYFPHDMEKYAACLKHANRQGEVNARNRQAGVLRRLMYNPHFDRLKLSLQQFIANLP